MNAVQDPKGQARAAKDAADEKAWRKQVEEREALQTAQAQHAANHKLERLARKEPIVADLLEELRALRASVDTLRSQNAKLETSNADLAAEAARAVREKADVQVERDELLGHVKTISARADKAEADVAKLGQDLEAARSDAGKARAELAKLKDKKAPGA